MSAGYLMFWADGAQVFVTGETGAGDEVTGASVCGGAHAFEGNGKLILSGMEVGC